MKRLPFFLGLLALALLAASIAYWAMQFYRPKQGKIVAAPQAAMADPQVDAAATLFGGQAAAAVATNFTLTGIVADGNDSVAIIVAEGSPPKALKVGRELTPGVKLAEVHARYVMLSDGGVMKRIDLPIEAKSASSGAPAGGQVMPAGGPPPAGEPPVSAGPVPAASQETAPPDTQTIQVPQQGSSGASATGATQAGGPQQQMAGPQQQTAGPQQQAGPTQAGAPPVQLAPPPPAPIQMAPPTRSVSNQGRPAPTAQ